MYYLQQPNGFALDFAVVGCFVSCRGKLLFLRRLEGKSQGGKWGIPGGKIDEGETPSQALAREIFEETGISIGEERLSFFKMLYVSHPQFNFTYHMFAVELDVLPSSIVLQPNEHNEAIWVAPEEGLAMDLVLDAKECLEMYIAR